MTFWSDSTNFVPKQQHRWVVSFSQKDYKPADPDVGKNYLFKEFVKSVDKPSFEIKSVQAKYLYSHVFNFPTRPVWKPITITFYDIFVESPARKKIKYFNKPYLEDNKIIDKEPDSVDPHLSTQAFFYKFLQDAGYFNPEELEKPDSLVRLRKYNFKKDMIDALVGNPGGVSNNNSDYYYSGGEKKFTSTLIWDTLKIQELDSKGKIREEWNLYNPLITDVKFDKLDYNSENVVTISVTIVYDWAELKSKNANKIQIAATPNEPATPDVSADETLRRGKAVPLTAITAAQSKVVTEAARETTISLSNPKTPSGPPPISTEIAGSPSYRAPPIPALEGAFTGPAAPVQVYAPVGPPEPRSPTLTPLSPDVSSYSSEDVLPPPYVPLLLTK